MPSFMLVSQFEVFSHYMSIPKLAIRKIQWKPVKVTPLKVNNRLRSTVDVGPVFYALYISNLNPDNVNHLRPQSC